MSSTAISNLACEPAHFMGGRENIAGKKGGGSTVAHKGHHCIRMLYLTFRVFYLQFACSICSSHVLFSIPRAPFAARVFHFLFACSFVLAFSFAARALGQGNPRTLFLLARFCARDFVAADLYGLLETTWRLTWKGKMLRR